MEKIVHFSTSFNRDQTTIRDLQSTHLNHQMHLHNIKMQHVLLY